MQTTEYQNAVKAVKEKKKFYKHLSSYVLVNTAFLFVSFFSGDGFFSWMPVMFFWGIGLGSHYVKVFGFPGSGVSSREWEERELEREMRRRGVRKSLPPARRTQMDDHLELKEMEKNYRESDLV